MCGCGGGVPYLDSLSSIFNILNTVLAVDAVATFSTELTISKTITVAVGTLGHYDSVKTIINLQF